MGNLSISREKVKWGIPLPFDKKNVTYVWVEALANYITAIGYESNPDQFKKLWPADIQLLAKDILKFHAIYWPAFLLAVDLELPKRIFIHGFFTSEGKKMSKTLGNVVNPIEVAEKYGVDTLRYFILREISFGQDGDFSIKRLEERYNADLANGLGNLVARLAKLCQLSEQSFNSHCLKPDKILTGEFGKLIDDYQIISALNFIWEKIRLIDQNLNRTRPWQIKDKRKMAASLTGLVDQLLLVAVLLSPFLPQSAKIITQTFSQKKINPPEALFIRK